MAEYEENQWTLVQIELSHEQLAELKRIKKKHHIRNHAEYARAAFKMYNRVLDHLDTEEGAHFINSLMDD